MQFSCTAHQLLQLALDRCVADALILKNAFGIDREGVRNCLYREQLGDRAGKPAIAPIGNGTVSQAGLNPNATDRQIVERASERQWIIVTVNGDDFVAEINQYLKETKKLKCHDLSGLVILPSDHEVQRHALRQIGGKLIFDGRHIGWKDVWKLDCCVRIKKNGTVHVTRFARCFYCKKKEST